MFNYYLNNILVNNPLNWRDFEEVIEYDMENNTLLYSYPLDLEFTGSAYQYLLAQSELNNCNYVDLKIEQNACGELKTIFIGTIFLSDLVINRSKCHIKAPVQDNSFASFINNNKSIEVQICEDNTGIKTKNGLSLTNQLNITTCNLDLFNTTSAIYQGTYTCSGFYLEDCFKFLIAYLSDLKIGFESTYLDRTLPIVTAKDNVKRLVVFSDIDIYLGARANATGGTARITLQELLTEVNRFYPIGYYVRYDFNNTPTFVLEDLDFFLNSSTSISFNTIKDVEESRATNLYYSSINIGGNFTTYNSDSSYLTFSEESLYTFGDETYFFDNQCNIDKTLNLKGSYIVDNNSLMELFTGGNVGVGELPANTFFIEAELTGSSSTEKALATLDTNGSNYHYNENLINIRVVQRLENFGNIYSQSVTLPFNLIKSSAKNFLKKYSFKKFISDYDYDLIKNSILSKIEINIDNNGKIDSGWIKRISRKYATTETNIELRS